MVKKYKIVGYGAGGHASTIDIIKSQNKHKILGS